MSSIRDQVGEVARARRRNKRGGSEFLHAANASPSPRTFASTTAGNLPPMSDISTNSMTIEATADDVRTVLFDLATYPEWSSAIKSVEVLEKDSQSRPTKVKMKVDAGVMKDNVTLDYDWSLAPEKLLFTFDDADLLTDMSGAYIVKDNGDDTTSVTYELTVALSMPVPAMMRHKAERATIDLALNELKKKLEE